MVILDLRQVWCTRNWLRSYDSDDPDGDPGSYCRVWWILKTGFNVRVGMPLLVSLESAISSNSESDDKDKSVGGLSIFGRFISVFIIIIKIICPNSRAVVERQDRYPYWSFLSAKFYYLLKKANEIQMHLVNKKINSNELCNNAQVCNIVAMHKHVT